MKFLITGASGQLGMEWVDFLDFKKVDVNSYSSTELDITKSDLIEQRFDEIQPDVVINCAGYTAVDKAESEVEIAELINSKGVERLARICRERAIKLVHYSTDYVFSGDEKDQQRYPDGYPEQAICNPINAYGRSKYMGEQEILQSGVDYLLIRVSWLCGKHGSNFVKTMLKLASQRDEINVVNDQFGAPTFCKHVVDDTYKLIKKGESGIYHLGSQGMISWYDFAKKIFEYKKNSVLVNPIDSKFFQTDAKRPKYSKLDTKKVEQTLNRPSISWKQGIRELLEEIKE